MIDKKFLILQLRPEDETSDNEYESVLKIGKLKPQETERIRIEKSGIPSQDLDLYAGIIVGGSPFDISTPEDKKSDIQKKIENDFQKLFDNVLDRDFPFLGICSGSGLLGSYGGAIISRKYGEAVGGVDIHLTEEGKKDPLLAGLPKTFRALVGHKEASESVPRGATLLATSGPCPVQMFRVKNNIYATQFHPEADPDVFELRIKVYRHHGYFSPDDAQDLIDRVQKEIITQPRHILSRFVERYKNL